MFRAHATASVRLEKPVVSGKESGCHSSDTVGCEEPFTTYGKTASSGQKKYDPSNEGDGSSDKWDFGDDSAEEELEHDVKPGGVKAQASGGKSLIDGDTFSAAPGGATSVRRGSGGIPEEPQIHISVDKLGRREHVPRRCVPRPDRE